ncbi:MAG: hypothetical protein IPQ23_02895 [Cytophagaceae bacterium]|nr:hypothetical protein [Cytophagaceae bacterium]
MINIKNKEANKLWMIFEKIENPETVLITGEFLSIVGKNIAISSNIPAQRTTFFPVFSKLLI